MTRILLLSNGHGEDLSGALIGKALRRLGHQVEAIPFVGRGQPYKEVGIRILGNAKEFSTGGLGYTSWQGRVTEFLQGQLFYLLGRVLNLLLVAKHFDLLVVIGDVVPVFAAWVSGRPVVTYLVAYSSHYEGRLRLPWPCVNCLLSKRFLGIYTRDKLTAEDLKTQLARDVNFCGNPFMDPVLKPTFRFPKCPKRLGLLPGSRRPELDGNLRLMLYAMECLPEERVGSGEFSLDMALVSDLDLPALRKLADEVGWELKHCSDVSKTKQLVHGQISIKVHRNSFIEVLQSSDVLLSMAGTAAEQAVGLAKPVVQLPGYGPQFTASFAEAQRRLLGPTVFCGIGKPGSGASLQNTADLILDVFVRIKQDENLQRECQHQAENRLGVAGGGQNLAEEITHLLFKLKK